MYKVLFSESIRSPTGTPRQDSSPNWEGPAIVFVFLYHQGVQRHCLERRPATQELPWSSKASIIS